MIFLFFILLLSGLVVAGYYQFKGGANLATSTASPTTSPEVKFLLSSNAPNATFAPNSIAGVPEPEVKKIKVGEKEVTQYPHFPGVYPADQLKEKAGVIETSKGKIAFVLLGEEAPKAASNFAFLASHNFYNGLTFHRVVPGFVIQGGDPFGNGTGGPGYKFEDEMVKLQYKKGVVAMANSGPNTNGSQFFIMLEDNLSLPPSYTIFGEVIQGQEVVDKIAVGDIMDKVYLANIVPASPNP